MVPLSSDICRWLLPYGAANDLQAHAWTDEPHFYLLVVLAYILASEKGVFVFLKACFFHAIHLKIKWIPSFAGVFAC